MTYVTFHVSRPDRLSRAPGPATRRGRRTQWSSSAAVQGLVLWPAPTGGPIGRLRQSRLPSGEQSIGDGRDYGLRDQDLGVEVFVLGVAGDDGYQVQVGDDVDNLTAVAARGEGAVATFGGDPPKPAVSHRDVGCGAGL